MTTIKEIIKRLQNEYKPTDHVAVAIWQIEDVMERAEEREKKITEKQAEEIIEKIDNEQDATIGISWNTIDCFLDEL